jgi:hypothetical protein
MMVSSPSTEMGKQSVEILSVPLVAAIGELYSPITRVRELCSIPASGPVTGCPPMIFVEVVLVISVVRASASPILRFLVQWCKVLSLRSAQVHSRALLLRLPHRLLPAALARPKWARTMMEPICSLVPSSLAALMHAAASAQKLPAVLVTHGFMTTMSAG